MRKEKLRSVFTSFFLEKPAEGQGQKACQTVGQEVGKQEAKFGMEEKAQNATAHTLLGKL